MFDFFRKNSKKKNIETKNIRNYNEAIKTIKYFIAILEWNKASRALEEISEKELNSFKHLLEEIDETGDNYKIQKEKEKITKQYQKKKKELEKLKEELKEKKEKYDKKIEKQRFTLRFKAIKKEIKNLIGIGKSSDALKLLGNFLEENPGNELVINFYNKEKKSILKSIEKEKEKQEKLLKQNAKLEALKLIGKTSNIDIENKKEKKNEKKGFFSQIKEKINLYKKIQQKLENKKLLDEITILIEEEDKIKKDLATSKLENIHKGLIKEIENDNILGYDFYGKILGASKISGDTFGFNEIKKKYTFFIADATGHGIRAGFIITLLTRLFNKFVENKSLRELIYEINNGLKQDLKSMNFITGIFFEVFKEKLDKINFVGLGHEPILIYRAKTKKIEKVIPGGLAAGIRIIKNPENIKVKDIQMQDGDILLTYSDGIIEAKSPDGKYYGLDRLEKQFKHITTNSIDIKNIYKFLVEDAKIFRGGASFDDDLTLLLLKRNIDKDEIKDPKSYLEEIGEASKLSKSEIKKIKGKTKDEIKEELEKIKKEKQLKTIIKQLENLWLTGEIISLKEEATRYIKQGIIHPKINYYLKKAIDNQQAYKISLKEERLQNKYKVLNDLMKKGDYSTVIKETEEIISKDGNI